MKDSIKQELQNKINFVNELSQVYPKYQTNVESLRYDVFVSRNDEDDWCYEFLVINYKGGARSIVPCTADSFSAIAEEITKYLNHGNYDNEGYYSDVANSEKIKRF